MDDVTNVQATHAFVRKREVTHDWLYAAVLATLREPEEGEDGTKVCLDPGTIGAKQPPRVAAADDA